MTADARGQGCGGWAKAEGFIPRRPALHFDFVPAATATSPLVSRLVSLARIFETVRVKGYLGRWLTLGAARALGSPFYRPTACAYAPRSPPIDGGGAQVSDRVQTDRDLKNAGSNTEK